MMIYIATSIYMYALPMVTCVHSYLGIHSLAPTLAKELCVANCFRYRVANDGLSYYCV